jgi:hypothetical protein
MRGIRALAGQLRCRRPSLPPRAAWRGPASSIVGERKRRGREGRREGREGVSRVRVLLQLYCLLNNWAHIGFK